MFPGGDQLVECLPHHCGHAADTTLSALSELSVLELDAEWAELLPEREALSNTHIVVIVNTTLIMPTAVVINLMSNNAHQIVNQATTMAAATTATG